MNNLAPNPVMCVMDVMGLAPYIQVHTPPHIPVNYMLECVLTVVGNAHSADTTHMQEHLVHAYIDDVMGDYQYDEAMARGVTDQEWFDWLALVKGEVARCAIELARTLFPSIKPILQMCDTAYPNGCTLEVYQLATDGLYVDLAPQRPVQPVPPYSIAG